MAPRFSTSRAPSRPAAVLWDMDGTLVDTEPYWIDCEYKLVGEFGGVWDDERARSLVGRDLRDSARILQREGGVNMPVDDIVNRLLDGVIMRVRRSVPWRPGARELLAALKSAGVPCALVTMSWDRFAQAVVDALPPGSFAAVISGDQVTNGKPHPEPYQAAATALGVRAKDCVAIEDSPTGLASAVAAGCRVFAVPNVVEIPKSRRYAIVPSLTDLSLARLGVVEAPTGRRKQVPLWRKVGPAIGFLAVLGIGAGTAVVVNRTNPPPPLKDIPVSAWAPYWVLDGATSTVAANGTLFHEISPFWFEARGAGDVGYAANVTPELVAPFLASARQSGARVVPSVADVMDAGGMAAVLADPLARAQHVAVLAALVRDNGFDGLDIDYERFAHADDPATWETTRVNWVAFLGELATALHAEGKVLSVAVPPIYDTDRNPESGYWVYDYAAMGDIVDRIRIMAYDKSWEEPGPIAPIDWVRGAVRAAKKAVADDTKLVLGIPLYGRNWVTGTIGTCSADVPGRVDPNQREVQRLIADYSAQVTHDDGTEEASFTYTRVADDASCTQAREVHFMDAEGARARVDLAREERIGGVVFWALGFDTSDVWAGITDVARPRTVDTTPATTAATTGSGG